MDILEQLRLLDLAPDLGETWAIKYVGADSAKSLHGGKSGARVLGLDIKCNREDGAEFDGAAILRVVHVKTLVAARREVEVLRRATSLPNEISAQRIPKLANWHFAEERLH